MSLIRTIRIKMLLVALMLSMSAFAQPKSQGNKKEQPQTSISQIDLSGVTVFNAEQLWQHAIDHSQKISTEPSIADNCESVKKIYRQAGYFLAEVNCSVQGSTLKVEVHEGKIRKIEISGVDEKLGQKISDIIINAVGNEPVTLERFERGVMLAKDLSGVSLTSEVIASDQSGNDLLRIAAQSVKQRGSLSIDNLPRNFGQGIYAVLTEEIYSTITPGDMFRINLLPSTDFGGDWSGLFGTGTYRTPLNNNGLYGELTVGTGLTKTYYSGPNQSPNNTFQKTNLASAVIGYPIIRNAHEFLYTMSEINYYALTGTNTGVNNTDTGVFRQFLSYSSNANNGASTRATVALSLGTSGVQVMQSVPPQNLNDSQFFSLRASGGYITPLNDLYEGLGLRLEGTLQYSPNSLPTVEKYFLGDRTRLRGYGYAEVIGDMGYAATAELAQYFHVGAKYLDSISVFGFFDVGAIKQNVALQGPYVNQTNLASFGIGIQTNSTEKFAIRAWYGVPLVSIPNGTQAYSPAFWLQVTQSW